MLYLSTVHYISDFLEGAVYNKSSQEIFWKLAVLESD